MTADPWGASAAPGSAADAPHARTPAGPPRDGAARSLLAAGVTSPALTTLAEAAVQLLSARTARISLLDGAPVSIAGVGAAPASGPAGELESALAGLVARDGQPVRVDDAATAVPPGLPTGAGAYLGVPLRVQELAIGAVVVHDPHARTWSRSDIDVLSRLARGIAVELELRLVTAELSRSAARLELALDAASIGSFDWDTDTGELIWDDRLIDMFGFEPDTFVGHIDTFSERVHPGDRERVGTTLARAVAERGELAMEYRIQLPTGGTRWISARGRVFEDPHGGTRLLGAAFDTTELRHGRDQVARVLETMTDAFFGVDRDWRFTVVNEHAARLLGRPADELVGRAMWEEFPAEVGASIAERLGQAMRSGEAVSFVERYPQPPGRYFEIRAWPGPDGLSVFFHDVTERRRAARERERAYQEAEAATARLTLLADMTQALVSTLDVDEAMARLLRIIVPRLSTWASVTLIDDTGRLRHTVARHADPGLVPEMERFAALQGQVATADSLARRVAHTGEGLIVPQLRPDDLSSGWEGDELTALLHRMGLASLILVPLQGRGGTLGVLVLAGDEHRPPFTTSDLDTAREVGQRAGLAIENAQLFAQQRTTAETLQQHLLPALPSPDHLEVAARYRPAGQAAQVGGDFYWGALRPDGALIAAIGDVSGHDLAATSWQAQLAPLLRGFAFEDTTGPADVLRRVDAAMAGLQIDTMATVVLARVEQTAADRAAPPGGGRRLRWSNAGHPPPVILRAAGGVETLDVGDAPPDLLLGLDPGTTRSEHDVIFGPGDTVLLYTDGLVERRGSPLDSGLARLRQSLATLGGLPLEALCDAVLDRMVSGEYEDDVALLAIKSRPAD